MIRSQKRFRNRSGFTLVHQMVIIAILPILMMAAVSWVHQSLKMSSQFRHRRECHIALNHLANQFQNDVHSCKSLKFDSDLNQVELTGHRDQQITFKIEGNDVQKTLTVDGEVTGRDNYRLSDEYFIEWDSSAIEKDSNRVTLNIFRYPTPYRDSVPDSLDVPAPKLECVITAKANRWKRSVTFGRETVAAEKGGAE